MAQAIGSMFCPFSHTHKHHIFFKSRSWWSYPSKKTGWSLVDSIYIYYIHTYINLYSYLHLWMFYHNLSGGPVGLGMSAQGSFLGGESCGRDKKTQGFEAQKQHKLIWQRVCSYIWLVYIYIYTFFFNIAIFLSSLCDFTRLLWQLTIFLQLTPSFAPNSSILTMKIQACKAAMIWKHSWLPGTVAGCRVMDFSQLFGSKAASAND